MDAVAEIANVERSREETAARMYKWGWGSTSRVLASYIPQAGPYGEFVVHQFDEQWLQRSVTRFPIPRRCASIEIAKQYENQLSRDALVVTVSFPGGEGELIGESWRCFYAVKEAGIALVRVEGSDREIRPGICGEDRLGAGPLTPNWGVTECLAALGSEDVVTILEALTWLGAIHPAMAEGPEDSRSAGQWLSKLGRDPRIVERIRELRESPNLWIRDAAQLCPGD